MDYSGTGHAGQENEALTRGTWRHRKSALPGTSSALRTPARRTATGSQPQPLGRRRKRRRHRAGDFVNGETGFGGIAVQPLRAGRPSRTARTTAWLGGKVGSGDRDPVRLDPARPSDRSRSPVAHRLAARSRSTETAETKLLQTGHETKIRVLSGPWTRFQLVSRTTSPPTLNPSGHAASAQLDFGPGATWLNLLDHRQRTRREISSSEPVQAPTPGPVSSPGPGTAERRAAPGRGPSASRFQALIRSRAGSAARRSPTSRTPARRPPAPGRCPGSGRRGTSRPGPARQVTDAADFRDSRPTSRSPSLSFRQVLIHASWLFRSPPRPAAAELPPRGRSPGPGDELSQAAGEGNRAGGIVLVAACGRAASAAPTRAVGSQAPARRGRPARAPGSGWRPPAPGGRGLGLKRAAGGGGIAAAQRQPRREPSPTRKMALTVPGESTRLTGMPASAGPARRSAQ